MDEAGEPRNQVIFYDENDVQYLAERGKGLQEYARGGIKLGAKVTGIYELSNNQVRILFDPTSVDSKFGNTFVTSFKQGDIG